MDLLITSAARQLLLFGHTLAFAFAIVAVVREDLALLAAHRIEADKLRQKGRIIGLVLLVLWVTGLSLIALETGDLASVLAKPKMLTKLTVVSLLTLNGMLLHWIAFPLLARKHSTPRLPATICVFLGSVSSVTWLYSAFVGVARIIAPHFDYAIFMGLYGFGLVVGLAIGLSVVRPRLERMMSGRVSPEAPEVGLVRKDTVESASMA
jgi:hypothetical protein